MYMDNDTDIDYLTLGKSQLAGSGSHITQNNLIYWKQWRKDLAMSQLLMEFPNNTSIILHKILNPSVFHG